MVFQCSEAKTIEKTMVLQGFVAENIEKPMVFQCSEAKTNGFRTLVFKSIMFFNDLGPITLKNQWFCKPGARKPSKKQWFLIISSAGWKNIVFALVFRSGNTDFSRSAKKQLFYNKLKKESEWKKSPPIFPDLGKFPKSVRKTKKTLKNIMFFKFPYENK